MTFRDFKQIEVLVSHKFSRHFYLQIKIPKYGLSINNKNERFETAKSLDLRFSMY